MATSLEARIARLEAANAARRAPPAFNSVAASARLISICTGVGTPVKVALSSPAPPATPAGRRAAEAARRAARMAELMDIALARQRVERFSDLA